MVFITSMLIDCSMLAATILDEVLVELYERGSFVSLRKSLDWQGAMIADELKLIEKHREDLQKYMDLVEQLAYDRSNMLDQSIFWEKKTELLSVSTSYDIIAISLLSFTCQFCSSSFCHDILFSVLRKNSRGIAMFQ